MKFLPKWLKFPASDTQSCVLCHDSTQVSDGICHTCLHDLAPFFTDPAHSCPRCFRHIESGAVCGVCQKKPPAFDRMWASVYYQPPVSSLIRELKHLADLSMNRPLARLMRLNAPHWLAHTHFDFVLPVPLSKERRLHRGFNQSETVAAILAEHYRWTLMPSEAVFRQHRPPQSTLKSTERLRNIKNTFQIRTALPPDCNILLIDDVFTTGSTLNELAQTLKKSGANRIDCWSLARVPVKK